MSLDTATESYLSKLTSTVSHILNGSLTGVYLHGSEVLGGYNPGRSDLDILIVTSSAISSAQKAALANALSQENLPCPAVGLEMSVVLESVCQYPTEAPIFEAHMTTAPTDCKFINGQDHGGDADLVLHFLVARAHGRVLAGKPVEDVFGAIDQSLVRVQLARELTWARDGAPLEYAILNACRAWAWLEDALVLGKVDGGRWVLEKMDSKAVQWALKRQWLQESGTVDENHARGFIDTIIHKLN